MAYQTTILCSWSCQIVLFSYVFDLGGPMCMIYGTVVMAIGQLLLMASLAEYCGIWPTAGGQQFYTQIVAPPNQRRFLSYVVGWCVLVGEISTSSSCAVNSAQVAAAFVEYTHPDLEWHPWMTWLVYTVFLVGPVVVNLLPRVLPAMNYFSAFFNIGGMITWAIVWLIMAPKNSTEFVFTEFLNNSGWTSRGWVFILSMYVPIYGLYGSDAVMHVVEEMVNPSKNAPKVMMWSMVWSAITALISAVIMGYTAKSWSSEMEIDQPYLTWFIDVTGSVYGGGVFCALIMMGLNFFIIVDMNLAGSRLAWSMAKDMGFPYSSYFSHISTKFGIPLRAMLALLVIDWIIGLLILGSDLAYWALISGGGITLQVAYCVPIICVVCRGRAMLPKRPHFDLGRFGYAINVSALAWSIITLLFFSFPQYVPVIGYIENMNWGFPMVVGVIILLGAYWVSKGRFQYLLKSNSILENNVVMIGDARVAAIDVVASEHTRTA